MALRSKPGPERVREALKVATLIVSLKAEMGRRRKARSIHLPIR